ncbi:MAG: hypothetical protein ACREMM_06315 [Gemmatimonadales bacterium]
MRKLIGSALLLAALALTAAELEAQRRPARRRAPPPAPAQRTSFGAQLDWGSNTDFGIGARVVFGLKAIAPRAPLDGIVSFDYYFPNAGDFWEINGNVAYRFRVARSSLGPYAGGGLNIGHVSGGGVSETRAGLNLLAGTTFKARNLTPFAEFRGVIGDFDQVVLTGGIRFSLR